LPCFTESSPAIDPNRLYVYAYGVDGFVHKYQVGDGTEIVGGGWPERVTFKPSVEKESANLTIATPKSGTPYLYVPMAGEDEGDYQGHLVTINLSTGSQHVFNTLCSNQTDVLFVMTPGSPDCSQTDSGIWGRSGVVYDPNLDRIFLATGNAQFQPGQFDWGDSVLELNPDGTGQSAMPLDSYTPVNQATLNMDDSDFGSMAPVILTAPPQSSVTHPLLQIDKPGNVYLLNRTNLSGKGGPGNLGGEISTITKLSPGIGPAGGARSAPATWINPTDQSEWVFVDYQNALRGLSLGVAGSGQLALSEKWSTLCSCDPQESNATTPLVVNDVVFVIYSGDLEARRASDGVLLWSDQTIASPAHWSSPVVANGILYVTNEAGDVYAYASPSNVPSPTATPTGVASGTPTMTDTPSVTSTATTRRATPTLTPTRIRTRTPTPTSTRLGTRTPTATPSP
jgi:hypothetical protein